VPIDDRLDRGELQIQSEFGFEGYVDLDGRELIPPRAFDGDWYRTGDLAASGADGTLAVLGRCDLSVNRQGVLLPLAEVESRMRALASVDEVAVAPGPENIRGRSLVAFCVISQGCQTTAAALRANYARIAPAFSVPEVVRIVSELPKLANGKVDRQALARWASEVP
jgi:acyl-coenzyme A synthetase/AMP-(fatty) acid ligase